MTTTTMTTSPSRVPIDCPRSIIAILGQCPPSSYIVAVGSERGQGTGSSSSSDSSDSDELLDEVEEEGGLGELTKSDSTSLEGHIIHTWAGHSTASAATGGPSPLGSSASAPRTRRPPREYALREHVLRARMSRDYKKNCFPFLSAVSLQTTSASHRDVPTVGWLLFCSIQTSAACLPHPYCKIQLAPTPAWSAR